MGGSGGSLEACCSQWRAREDTNTARAPLKQSVKSPQRIAREQAGHTKAGCDVRSAASPSPAKAGAAAEECAARAVALARAIPQAVVVAASKTAQSQNSAWGAFCVRSAAAARQPLLKHVKQAPRGARRGDAHLSRAQHEQHEQQRRSSGGEAGLGALRR